MKRIGYIFDKITDIENIKTAILEASKGKRHKFNVARVLDNIDTYAEKVQRLLISKEYVASEYEVKKNELIVIIFTINM